MLARESSRLDSRDAGLAEEIALGRRIQAGDAEALRELVERNLRFVVQVANKYKGYGLPLADLINEGNLGLLHAAGKARDTLNQRLRRLVDPVPEAILDHDAVSRPRIERGG